MLSVIVARRQERYMTLIAKIAAKKARRQIKIEKIAVSPMKTIPPHDGLALRQRVESLRGPVELGID